MTPFAARAYQDRICPAVVYGVIRRHDIGMLRADEYNSVFTQAEFEAAKQAAEQHFVHHLKQAGGGFY